jgi:Tol biopolymer transport system component
VVAATLLLAPAAHGKGLVVFVCGKDLCSSTSSGKSVKRLTRDGARTGGYRRPSLSLRGRRLAYLQSERGQAFTARVTRRGLRSVRRIGPAPDGPRDATQFDVAISPDGRRVAWVELRINVVFSTIDYRRYMANVDGSDPRQVAGNGGRPFVAFFDATRIVREGITDAFDGRPDFQAVDQGLCVPDPESEQNGTCGDKGPQVAYDPAGRHLRHPAPAPGGKLAVATAYAGGEDIDDVPDHAGALVLFAPGTALPVRELTPGPDDAYPSFAPDGKAVIFERDGVVRRVPVGGGAPRRVVRGRQPTWGF